MGLAETLKVVANSLSFFILLALAYYLYQFNSIVGIIFFIASIDQIEDVYRTVTGIHPIPAYLAPFDIIFETILVLTGIFMLVIAIVYWYSFESWFFAILTVLSLVVIFTALSDIADDIRTLSAKLMLASETAKASAVSMEDFKFFRRLGR